MAQELLDPELDALIPTQDTQTDITRRYYSQKERESMDESDFAGPHRSFPIKTQEDVHNAARLIGHADDPEAVKRKIIAIAKRKGFSLPDSWEAEGDKDGDDGRAQSPDLLRASDPSDSPVQEHQNESGNTQEASSPDILRSMPSETSIYAPILRVDRAKREVVVRATAEDLDSYGTVIGFEGSKKAFENWRGNIREMHDPTKAVGRAIQWKPIDESKEIELTLRVSKGAEDTWQKVLDGTLAGASIGARNGKWGKRQWNGKEVPFLERYDLVEVSLVDNPSCPGCDVKVVRADGMATDVLDFTEDEQPSATPDITRAGARIATNTMASMHKSRDHMLHGLREQLANCSCSECQSALHVIDPDNDGDIDIVPSLDTDHDAAGGDGSGSGIMKFVQTEITRHMSPIVTRMNGIAARLATTDTTTAQVPDPEMTRRLDSLEQKLTGLDEVRSLLSEVKGLAEKSTHLSELIAAQPQQGGPIVNSAALRQLPANQPDPITEEVRMVERLSRAGILNKNQQVEAALYLQRLENGRR